MVLWLLCSRLEPSCRSGCASCLASCFTSECAAQPVWRHVCVPSYVHDMEMLNLVSGALSFSDRDFLCTLCTSVLVLGGSFFYLLICFQGSGFVFEYERYLGTNQIRPRYSDTFAFVKVSSILLTSSSTSLLRTITAMSSAHQDNPVTTMAHISASDLPGCSALTS